MRIQNNMMALNTYRQYNIANNQTAGYAEKLSSGYQINRAGDDAAGLAISEKMRAQIRGLNMASKNSLDAVSLIQTAEGALQSTHDILQRMRELAVQSASDTNEQVIDRGALDQEFQQLKQEIDETARVTRFNDQNLIDGTFQKAFYSTDITKSLLTTGTVAQTSRVGVKSDYNQNGTYKINVQYIEAQSVQYARASAVTTEGANGIALYDSNINSSSAISSASFEAVVGAAHNGKTFTISASGTGTDLFDQTNGLKVTIDDGDTVYTGEIIATDMLHQGSTITINFEGVGALTLDLRNDALYDDKAQNVFNISSMLNGKEIKFLKSPVAAIGGNTATTTGSATGTYTTTGLPATAGAATSITLKAAASAAGALGAYTGGGSELTVVGATGALGGTTMTFGAQTVTASNLAWNDFVTDGLDSAFSVDVDFAGLGTYTLSFGSGAGRTAANISALMETAIQAFVGLTTTEVYDGAYNIKTTADVATGDTYAGSTLSTTSSTFALGNTGDVTIGDLEFSVAYSGGTKTFSLADGNLSVTREQVDGGAFDPLKAQILTFDLEGYGKFTMEIGETNIRTLADLNTDINAALGNLVLGLGQVLEGRDTVAATDAQIALTLNGEVVTLKQNDTTAAFDNSGITLNFDAIDMSTVSNDTTATLKFTTNTAIGNQIHVHVGENKGKALTIQTGANQGDELDINIDAMDLEMLGLTDSSIATQKSASRAITEVNNAINQVSTQRAALGALQNRLNFKIANLDTSAENLQAAESRIRDTDMAKVMTAFTKSNILGQAATAMLAQANSQPQNVLQLLR